MFKTPLRLMLLALASSLVLSAGMCSPSLTPTTAPTVGSAALCDDVRTPEPNDGILREISYDSELDTPETVAEVLEHNAVVNELCPGTRD